MGLDRRLRKGYRAFRETTFARDRARYEELANYGQSPHTLVIACSDSRVLPQTILSAGPGELFIVRNVAAMVPPFESDDGFHGTSAAIEFAVTALGVSTIAVMGHAGCGGVASVVDQNVAPDSFVFNWMRPLREWLAAHEGQAAADPALRKSMLEQAAVHLSLRNLMTFPFVAERVEERTLALEGLLFNIHDGELSSVIAEGETEFRLQGFLDDD
jgi:carbonic anhydrase